MRGSGRVGRGCGDDLGNRGSVQRLALEQRGGQGFDRAPVTAYQLARGLLGLPGEPAVGFRDSGIGRRIEGLAENANVPPVAVLLFDL